MTKEPQGALKSTVSFLVFSFDMYNFQSFSFIVAQLLATIAVTTASLLGSSRRAAVTPPPNIGALSVRGGRASVARPVEPRPSIVSQVWRRLRPIRGVQAPLPNALPGPADDQGEEFVFGPQPGEVFEIVPAVPDANSEVDPAVANFVPEDIPIDPVMEAERQKVVGRRGKAQDRYKELVPPLTQQQRDIAYGMLLGDAHASPMGWNVRLEFAHSTAQAAFIDDLFKAFRLYTVAAAPRFISKKIKGKYDPQAAYGFETFTHPIFSSLHEAFYSKQGLTKAGNPSYVRRIPEDIDSWLTPRVLAYHIMCDGGNTNDGALNLNTHGFLKEDTERYRDALKRLFGLKTTIQKRVAPAKTYHFIYIPKGEMERLRKLVTPYMRPYFLYKIGIEHPLNIGRIRTHKR